MSGPATARSVPSSIRVTHGTVDAVVEAKDEFGAHGRHAPRSPDDKRTRSDTVSRGGMKSISGDGSRRGLELGFQDQRVRADSGG